MLMLAKIILFFFAVVVNYRHKNLLILTMIIGADVFLPIPTDEGRAAWCTYCIMVDSVASVLVLLVDTEVTLMLCMSCVGLIVMHLVYLQAGRANFPEYRLLLPSVESIMLALCAAGGMGESKRARRVGAAVK